MKLFPDGYQDLKEVEPYREPGYVSPVIVEDEYLEAVPVVPKPVKTEDIWWDPRPPKDEVVIAVPERKPLNGSLLPRAQNEPPTQELTIGEAQAYWQDMLRSYERIPVLVQPDTLVRIFLDQLEHFYAASETELWDCTRTAKFLDCSNATVTRLLKAGELTNCGSGGRPRILAKEAYALRLRRSRRYVRKTEGAAVPE